jgi:hypothetical protein
VSNHEAELGSSESTAGLGTDAVSDDQLIAMLVDRARSDGLQLTAEGGPGREGRLHDLQAQNRADQQGPHWQRLYASGSGIEGTMSELGTGHRMRRCRYHGMAKAHVQHLLAAIAVNSERLNAQEPDDSG